MVFIYQNILLHRLKTWGYMKEESKSMRIWYLQAFCHILYEKKTYAKWTAKKRNSSD